MAPLMEVVASTFFITFSAYQNRQLLQAERMADLLIEVLYRHREQNRFLLHAFVVMPNHVHLLITPQPPVTLERSLQFIKGGFSFRVKKDLGYCGEIWQRSFYDHRVRDWNEFCRIRRYIHENPVRRGLISLSSDYAFSSANLLFKLDEVPQRLKPISLDVA